MHVRVAIGDETSLLPSLPQRGSRYGNAVMMRHGETLFNVLRRKQGWCDSPLTERGIEQALRAGEWFAEQGITFDHVYSSTSERCCDTCELVVSGAPYVRVKGLKEWNSGKFEGVTEDLNPELPYGDFYVPFGGEAELEFRKRLITTICELMRRPNHENALIQWIEKWEGYVLGLCFV